MNCPDCASALQPATHEGVPHQRCPQHGRWFDFDGLRAVVRSTEADRPAQEEQAALAAEEERPLEQVATAETTRACPVCGQAMAKLNYGGQSGIYLDTCHAHGLWLEGDELERVEAWYEGTSDIPPAEMAAWRATLDAVEREHDARAAAQAGADSRYLGWLYRGVTRWWLARDDRDVTQ